MNIIVATLLLFASSSAGKSNSEYPKTPVRKVNTPRPEWQSWLFWGAAWTIIIFALAGALMAFSPET